MARVFNFSAGPAALPEDVLRQVADEMLDWHGSGQSVMEMSHRGKDFMSIAQAAEADLRELLAVPDGYKVNAAASAEDRSFTYVPAQSHWQLSEDAAYVHYTSNETIGGVEFHWIPDTGDVSLVSDLSSDFLSRPVDVARYGLIYAGAQKNVGPAGLTIVIVREDLIGRARPGPPAMLDYATHAYAGSMYNTPPPKRSMSPGWCSVGCWRPAGSRPRRSATWQRQLCCITISIDATFTATQWPGATARA